MIRFYKNRFYEQIQTPKMAQEVKTLTRRVMGGAFGSTKRLFLKLFYEHVITREIANGPDSANLSRTNSGYGNLYGFLGFNNDEENPVQSDLLRQALLLAIKRDDGTIIESGENYVVRYDVKVDDSVIYNASKNKLDWANNLSWIEVIETGLDNFAYYLYPYSDIISRSRGGVQIRNKVKGRRSFMPRPYLSSIIETFKSRVSEIRIT